MTSRISGQTSTFDFVLSPSWENKKGKLCPEIPESSNIERGYCGMIVLSSLPSLRQVSRKCYNNSSIAFQFCYITMPCSSKRAVIWSLSKCF